MTSWTFRILLCLCLGAASGFIMLSIDPGPNAQPITVGSMASGTLYYGLLWVLLLGMVRTLLFLTQSSQQIERRRRGHCPKCAYNLRGDFDNGCSECGWGRD